MKRKRDPESLMMLLLLLVNKIPVLQRESYSRKHKSQCKAKNARCEKCQMIGHFKRCCKKLGNFPKDHSNRQNQSSSTGSGRMNMATTVPQLDAEFFDERGLPKVYNLPPAPQI